MLKAYMNLMGHREHFYDTEKNLGFIINCNIKYRMGKELEEDV